MDDRSPTPDLDTRLARVREELTALPRRPRVRELFAELDALERSELALPDRIAPRNELLRQLGHYGVEHHRYRLEPPLPEEQVAAFEARNQIRLPEDYRAFITQVAGGGAGPSFYRMVPLRPDDVNPHLGRPFPFSPERLPSRTWGSDPAFDQNWAGTKYLTDEGCTFAQLLVVTGPQRGRVVRVDFDCNAWPEFDPAPDFLTWYENWLYQRKPTGPRDDEALARVVLDGGERGPGAEDAVRACYHLAAPYPLTSDAAVEVLAAGVRGGAPAAGRARAVWALGEMADQRSRELGHVKRHVEAALGDPDPAVRARAIEYADADARTTRGFLHDEAPEVVAAALWALAWQGEHQPEALRRLLTSPSATARAAAAEVGLRAYAFPGNEWPGRAGADALDLALGEMFLAVAFDPVPAVRAAAISVVSARAPERGVPAFLAASHDADGDVRFRAIEALRERAGKDPMVDARLLKLTDAR